MAMSASVIYRARCADPAPHLRHRHAVGRIGVGVQMGIGPGPMAMGMGRWPWGWGSEWPVKALGW